MSTRTPECWANDPNAEALRIEVSPGRSLLLPHDQFMFAELTGDGDDQNLKLVFAAHEVLIRGRHLQRIETGMQRMNLSLVTKLPSHPAVIDRRKASRSFWKSPSRKPNSD